MTQGRAHKSHRHGSWTTRRNVVKSGSAALSSFALPASQRASAATYDDPSVLDELLKSSSILALNVDSTSKAAPFTNKLSAAKLVRALSSKRAIFLGEHHPELRDHLLQAAILRSLCAAGAKQQQPMAVGIEAVQRQFQPVLDGYIAREIGEKELFDLTDWERRWYWSFEAYAPIFRLCRQYGVDLVALDCNSEDKAQVELGGLAALEGGGSPRREYYIPDGAGFERFGRTRAFDAYVAYTLRPPYAMMKKVGAKMTASTTSEREMSFGNFLARQSLRDEAMASASAAWLTRHPNGRLVGLVGGNHVKFGCGVPARTARMLPGGLEVVSSVLLNPTPASTFIDPWSLRVCDRTAVAHEACMRNDIEVQNYVLQVPYAAARAGASGGSIQRDRDEAASAMQAKRGSSVLALADYVIFSPT